jgi:hypothetical protein
MGDVPAPCNTVVVPLIVPAKVFTTLTVKKQVLVLPEASVAVYVIVDKPNPKLCDPIGAVPDNGATAPGPVIVQVSVVDPQLSVAVGSVIVVV